MAPTAKDANEARAKLLARLGRAVAAKSRGGAGYATRAEDACLEALAHLDVNAPARTAGPVLRVIGEAYLLLGRKIDARRVLRLALHWSDNPRELPREERRALVAALRRAGDFDALDVDDGELRGVRHA